MVTLIALLACKLKAQPTQLGYDAAGNQVAVSGGTSLAPSLATQPQSQLLQGNGPVVFSVVAGGTGLSYQWLSNGVAIAGANGDSLVLTNLSGTNFANYSVIVSNASGVVTSTPAAIWPDSHGSGMPDWWQMQYFGNLNQPPDGDYDGDGVSNVNEYREGTNPTNAASFDPRLAVLNSPHGSVVASPNHPYYTLGEVVTVTAVPDSGQQFLAWSGNISGTKPLISLLMDSHKVITASFGLSLPVALDNTNLVWTTGGDVPWAGQTEVSADGLGAAQSGLIYANQQSWLQAVTNLSQPMQLSFWWGVSSQPPDALSFSVDGIVLASIAGEALVWRQVQTNLPAGNHTLIWNYTKGAYDAPTGILYSDSGWVDEVVLTPTSVPPVLQSATQAGGTITLSWSALAGRTYQLQYQTNLNHTNWINLTNLTATSSTATASGSIAPEPQRFYRVVLLP